MPPKQYISDILRISIFSEGLEPALTQYLKIRNSDLDKYDTNEDEINELGYDLLNLNNVKAALEVFRINVELHKDSSNAYDSLAEAFYLTGNLKKALENYQKSLELNSKNRNAQNMINIIHEIHN
jgi:tetratricopeptide (TPR) repeat protein